MNGHLRGNCSINKIKRYTLICAISNRKIIATKIISKTTNGEDFLDFIKNDLRHIKNSYLFLDNARIHHYKKIKEYIVTTSNKLIYNVPYSPEYNPIEMVFSKSKYIVRKDWKRNLLDNIYKSIKNITATDLKSFYKKSLSELLK